MKAMAFCSVSVGNLMMSVDLIVFRLGFFSGISVDSSDVSSLGGSNLECFGGRPRRGLLKRKKCYKYKNSITLCNYGVFHFTIVNYAPQMNLLF